MSARAAVLAALGALLLAGALGALVMSDEEEPDGATYYYTYKNINVKAGWPIPDLTHNKSLSGFTYTASDLPDGLVLNSSTGTITGTPTEPSDETTYSVTAKKGTTTHTIKFTMTVRAPGMAAGYAVTGKSFDSEWMYRTIATGTTSSTSAKTILFDDLRYCQVPGTAVSTSEIRSYCEANGFTGVSATTSINGMKWTVVSGTYSYTGAGYPVMLGTKELHYKGTPSNIETDVFLVTCHELDKTDYYCFPYAVMVHGPLAYSGPTEMTIRPGSCTPLAFNEEVEVSSCTGYISAYYTRNVPESTWPSDDPNLWAGINEPICYYDGEGEVDLNVQSRAAYGDSSSTGSYAFTNTASGTPTFTRDYFDMRLTVIPYDYGYTNSLSAYGVTVTIRMNLAERVIKASQDTYDFYVTASGASYDPLTVSADYSGATWAVSSGEGGFSLSSSGAVTPSASPVSAGEYGSQVACTSPSDPTNVATVPLTAHVVPDLVFGGDPNADGVAYMTSS